MAGASGLSSAQSAMLIQSAMIIAGIGTLIQLFPLWKIGSGLPIVAASVVTAIGFSLLSVGASSFGGGSGSENFGSATNWILGTITLLCCIIFNILAKSYWKQLSVLFGLVVGYIVAIASGAIIMILAGIFPFFGALLATLPDAVLGGCTLMMFGNIVVSGLQMIGKCGYTQRNITIAALSLSIGIGFTQVPEIFSIFPQIVENVFAENCVAVVFLVSIILNLVLPKNMEAAGQTENK